MFLDYPVTSLALATLVVLAGIYVRARQADENLARRWLLFLFAAWALLIGTQLLIRGREMYGLEAFLQPAMVGTLAALFVHLMATHSLWSRAMIWITLPIVLVTVALLVCLWEETDPVLVLTPVIIALTWQVWEWRGKRRWLAYLALLLLLLTVGGWMLNPNVMLMNKPKWVYFSFFVVNLCLWPVVAVILAARLVYSSIDGDRPSNWIPTVSRLALVALLLLSIGYYIVTEAVWVRAEDGLHVMPALVSIVATAVAMLLAWAFRGCWRRLVALAFALVVMLSAASVSEQSSWISQTELTEARAEKIDWAVQRYYECNGRYPPDLAALAPFYLWRIPQPMIFRDQTWCYEGGDGYYRLGYVYQPGFGWPEGISIRIHAAAGDSPEPSWPCDDALERAKSQSPWQ